MYTVKTVQTIGATLSLYEYLITFKDEVRYIWQRECSSITVAFVIIRYTNLLYCLLRTAQIRLAGPEDDAVCRALYTFMVVMQIATFAGVGLFGSIRVYAVTNKSRTLSALVSILMTGFITCQLYANFSNAHIYAQTLPDYGCNSVFEPSAMKKNMTIGTCAMRMYTYFASSNFSATIGMSFGLVGELLVQLATWRSTFQLLRSLKQRNISHKVSTLLLRDGTCLYSFFVVWILTSELAFEQALVSIDSTALSMAVCRFIFRFHQAYRPAETVRSVGGLSTIAGTLGAPLHTDAQDGKEDHFDCGYDDGEIVTPTRVDLWTPI